MTSTTKRIFLLVGALLMIGVVAHAEDSFNPEENPGVISGTTSQTNPACPKNLAPGILTSDFSKSKAKDQETQKPGQGGESGESTR